MVINATLGSGLFASIFQEFYREVLIQRENALRAMSSPLPEEPQDQEIKRQGESESEDFPPSSPSRGPQENVQIEILTDKIQNTFITLFNRFMSNTEDQVGQFMSLHAQEVLYAMAAFLDEVFLSFPWVGQERWKNNLMEKRYFHTQVAGELLFKKVDDLIQANDPTRSDLAIIYLLTLGLGFRGKYRGEDDEGKLEWYRQQLFLLSHKQPSDLFMPQRQTLWPDTYQHNLHISSGIGLPNLQSWIVIFAALGFIYLLISTFMWYGVVRDVDSAIELIMNQSDTLGTS